jgi:hypothetical protein
MEYHTAKKVAEGWARGVTECITANKRKFSIMSAEEYSANHPHAVAGFRVGGAVLILNVCEKDGEHQPVCTVTEAVRRRHRVGVGHSHDYFAMVDGHPNYLKAVRNLISRADDIEELDIDYASHKSVTHDMAALAAEEMVGIIIPGGVHVNRHLDGTYTIHVPTFKCSAQTARSVLLALSR